jgi:RHS repeat-associated protein
MLVVYDSTEVGDKQLQWLVQDQLGSTRMVVDLSGSLTGMKRHDYLPFGEELGAGVGIRTAGQGYPPPDDQVRQKFGGYERDNETGLDFAQARYFGSTQGRFTSVDPLQESATLGNPQSWNRYTYALNNPLVYIDPTGELWIASGDANNPYRWVDECPQGGTCYQSVAAAINTGVAVYGSQNARDIRLYASNENGVVFVTGIARHPDAKFNSAARNQPHPEHFLSPEAAAALFNAARDYADAYPDDSNIVFTAGSAETGNAALNEQGRPIHRSHRNGQNIDMRYMGVNGRPLVGNTASANADVDRMETLFDAFAGQRAGLGAALTGTPERFGFGPLAPGTRAVHQNHFHLQRNYPRPPQPARRR